ncbi:MAG: Asp-tRNA(Asn)/Glu-tRNA(Gln) amidotransferase subunit GatB [Candidatus Paceibacterota bacterium]|jgi:aspartyl-tRNA(Asn)/glutamyl-tRNA(Gln) amidotransferase subunit B
MENQYVPTIGLEIHAELKTASKMFCSCPNDPEPSKPNINVCPICLGHPGTLPVLNMEAIRHVLRVGLSVNGSLADFTEWDRKNYFYPDIPKGYQISQYKYPLISGGELSGIAIERIHLEEDTAQSTHDTHKKSLVDFNRSGLPLMELVTKPVIHDAKTAVTFAKELQLLLRYLSVGDANMQKGEMRIEANISLAKKSDTENKKFGTKTEIKNLNSFRALEQSIAFEISRQTSLLSHGGKVVQETRGWDDKKEETFSQRIKESSHDYRYFPDPDIPKLKISEIKEFHPDVLMETIPELPWNKRERLQNDYQLTVKEVDLLIESPDIANYFDSIVSSFKGDQKKIRLTANYLLTDYLGMRNREENKDHEMIPADSFSKLIDMIASGTISSRGAKDLLSHMSKDTSSSPTDLADKHGLIQKSDSADLEPMIVKILADNVSVVNEYKNGKTASLQYLIGQVMKLARGSANPEIVRKILIDKLTKA